MKNFLKGVAVLVLTTPLPALALTQTSASQSSTNSFDKLGQFLLQFIVFINNALVPLLFAVAFLVFIWGIFLYFIQGGANEEKRDQGKQLLVYGLAGFFIMVSVWGLVNVLVNSAGLNNSARPTVPTFGAPSGSSSNTNSATFPASANTTP